MLVLSRKTNESIVIGEDIKITIVAVQGDKVRIGVEAPKNIPVHRQEVHDQIIEQEANCAGRTRDTGSENI